MEVLAVMVAVVVSGVRGHSWIACTDYLEENGNYWDASLCRAYPRHGYKYTPKNDFGLNTSYHYKDPREDKPCLTLRDDTQAYTDQYPMAVYHVGQKIVLAHPTKKHVSEKCSSKYIPDSGSAVYRSSANYTSNLLLSQLRSQRVVDFGVSPYGYHRTELELTQYPKTGFQNAPKFCDDQDRALATNAFYLPQMEPGRYTFMWKWSYRSTSGTDTYTTCWEADVMATRLQRDSVLHRRGLSTNQASLLHGKSLATGSPPTLISPVTMIQVSHQMALARQMPPHQSDQTTMRRRQGYGPWSKCSVTCGPGWQMRRSYCHNYRSGEETCDGEQPVERRKCFMAPCKPTRNPLRSSIEIREPVPEATTPTQPPTDINQEETTTTPDFMHTTTLRCLDGCLKKCYISTVLV